MSDKRGEMTEGAKSVAASRSGDVRDGHKSLESERGKEGQEEKKTDVIQKTERL